MVNQHQHTLAKVSTNNIHTQWPFGTKHWFEFLALHKQATKTHSGCLLQNVIQIPGCPEDMAGFYRTEIVFGYACIQHSYNIFELNLIYLIALMGP
jgi:hypothetical protein